MQRVAVIGKMQPTLDVFVKKFLFHESQNLCNNRRQASSLTSVPNRKIFLTEHPLHLLEHKRLIPAHIQGNTSKITSTNFLMIFFSATNFSNQQMPSIPPSS